MLQVIQNCKTVFTMGVYDCFHVGHLRILERAKKLGDILVVGVVEDYAVRKEKGDKRPIIPFDQRIEIIKNLKCVDNVVGLTKFNPIEAFQFYPKIDIYVRGEDQDHIDLSEMQTVYNPVVVILPRTKGVSTSQIVEKLNATNIK